LDVSSLEEHQTPLYVVALSLLSTVLSTATLLTTGTLLNIDLKSGATHYEKFGPNPRVIIDILLDPKMEA